MMKASFKDAGQAKLDRLDQDETQRVCSQYAGREIPKDISARIEQQSLATIRYPSDGKLVGDWQAGEKIAQEGRGKQFNDDPSGPVGANCYACHRLAPQELSYGTIGPVALSIRQRCAVSPTTHAAMRGARFSIPTRTLPAATCRASDTTVFSPSSRFGTSSRC